MARRGKTEGQNSLCKSLKTWHVSILGIFSKIENKAILERLLMLVLEPLPPFLDNPHDSPATRAWLAKLWALRYRPPVT